MTSARWNWIMDDPPITRLSGSKRFEHRCFGHRSTDEGEEEGSPPCITWPSTFSLLLILRCNFFSFCFSFLFFLCFLHPFLRTIQSRPGPAPVRKNGKLDDSWPTTTFGPGLSAGIVTRIIGIIAIGIKVKRQH